MADNKRTFFIAILAISGWAGLSGIINILVSKVNPKYHLLIYILLFSVAVIGLIKKNSLQILEVKKRIIPLPNRNDNE